MNNQVFILKDSVTGRFYNGLYWETNKNNSQRYSVTNACDLADKLEQEIERVEVLHINNSY